MTSMLPQNFIDAMASFYGAGGGNPASPIWLCGAEWSGGFDPAGPAGQSDPEDEFFAVNELSPIKPEKMKQFLKGDWSGTGNSCPGGSAFYRTQVRLLKAIIDPEGYRYDAQAPYDWVDEYQFFNKDGYGLSLNAFPVAMKGRTKAPDRRWREHKVLKVQGKLLSLAEWTGIPDFEAYQNKCAAIRNRIFCALRRKYQPPLIYCGGYDASQQNTSHLLQIWTDEQDKYVLRLFPTKLEFAYRWLNNGENKAPTLLVVGYFFGNQRLNSKRYILECGRELRFLCERELGKAWLRKEAFFPAKRY